MKNLFVFTLLILLYTNLCAQEIKPHVLSSAGNQHIVNSLMIEWTLGELSIMTLNGSTNIITQGFHQPKLLTTNIGESLSRSESIAVYPNPTSDFIQLEMNFGKFQSVFARMIDLKGTLIWENEFYGQKITESISLKRFPEGSYLLLLLINHGESQQTFKIQKIN